jgi:Urocanase Rossmann-like domain
MIPSSGVQLDFPKIEMVYGRFAALAALDADLGGLLLLYAGLEAEGIAMAMAANVAGTASLGIEPDAARAKLALRAGVCDFVVNSLDEALRILKNEVRQRRAASVVVTGEVDATVAEIVARGVQPDILGFAVPELIERGARLLQFKTDGEKDRLRAVGWSVQREPIRWLPLLDALAVRSLEESGATTEARTRWLEAAPRYLGRTFAGQRYLLMTEVEADHFVAAVEAAVRSGEVQVAASVTQDGEAKLIET